MKISFNKFHIVICLIFTLSSPLYAQTSEQINDFTKAAKFDDLSEVKSLIAQGVSPNAVDSRGNPMLLLAIREKSLKVTEFLIKNPKIDVDLSNQNGETPLMIASIEGDLPVVQVLVLQKHAMIDHIGWTPLHYACAKGHLEVARFLIANGAVVDSLSPGDTTPLMMAVQSGNEYLVKLLLDKGANLQLRNAAGFSAIDIADIYSKQAISEGLKSRWQKLYKEPYQGPSKPIVAGS
jgi:ankyrin repeat protein